MRFIISSESWRGVKAALPIVIGFIPFALVLGTQATQQGLSLLEVPFMTGLNFAGGSEFAAIGVWASPPPWLLIVALTLLVNSRYILMSATLTPYLQHWPKRRIVAALFLMCDETWALGLRDAQQRQQQGLAQAVALSVRFYFAVAVTLYLTWVSCSALGALFGPHLGDIKTYGFDMAFPAVFLVLLKGLWKNAASAGPWVISLLVAAFGYWLLPGAWYVACGTLAGLLSAYMLAPNKASLHD